MLTHTASNTSCSYVSELSIAYFFDLFTDDFSIAKHTQASGAAAAAAAAMNINVFLRVRPLSQEYTGNVTLTVMDDTSVALCAPAPEPGQKDYKGDSIAMLEKVELNEQDKYKFSQVFGPSY